MFGRCFSALLVPVVRSKMLRTSLHWNVFWMFNEVFFSKFLECQCSLNLFEGYSIQAKMSCLKFHLSARMKIKNLPLDEKMKLWTMEPKIQKWDVGWLQISCVSNNSRNPKLLQREYEFFKRNCKKLRHRQHRLINEILIAWYKTCASANVFADGPMLKEEAMLIKERSNNRKV